jgi:TfoX/Sxy family transcriptional regulator of competence genes
MAKPAPGAPAETVRLYEALIATLPGVERKGAKLPYTSLNGNMFSILSAKGVMGLRLSKADREAFLKDHGASLYADYGTVMPEYVAVPADLLADTERMTSYVAASFAYAQTLRPKATTKKRG